jgi:hypothetical protein
MKSLATALAALCFISVTLLAAEKQPAMPAAGPLADSALEEVPHTGIEVMKMVLTQSLEGHEPGPALTSAKVGDSLIGWTQIRSGLGEVTVTHRWLHEKKNHGDVPLVVKTSPWRTWSRKTVAEPGQWTLQVLNTQGSILKELPFTVNP